MNNVPREEKNILDELRADRDLIERLKISPNELDELSKCVLLGTLTCKQDMLFILRVIREANDPSLKGAAMAEPADAQPGFEEESLEDEGDPTPDFSRLPVRVAPAAVAEPGSLERIVRAKMPEQFGIFFWVIALAGAFIWTGITAMVKWRDTFIGVMSASPVQTASSSAWYGGLDHFQVLLSWELFFVAGVLGLMYVRSRSGTRHLKIKPGQGQRVR